MNCDCHCNGKCKMLGGLEQKIMEVLWASSTPLKPSEVLKNMNGDHAYTTIMTVLKRMSDKKLIHRVAQGNTYLYSPIQDKETFAASALDDLFTRLFSAYGSHVVISFTKVRKQQGY
jgi:predicted transcriptional regulator